MTEEFKKMIKRMKTTAYARFFSARRYEKLNNYSLFSLSTASFCLIFITLFQRYSDSHLFNPNALELAQLIASITIATLSIVVSFSSYSIKSEKMRTSGEDINQLISKVEYLSIFDSKPKSNKKLKKIKEKYEVLKGKSLNHKEFEFEYGKAERKREDENTPYKLTLKSKIENHLPFIPYIVTSILSIMSLIYSLTVYFLYVYTEFLNSAGCH